MAMPTKEEFDRWLEEARKRVELPPVVNRIMYGADTPTETQRTALSQRPVTRDEARSVLSEFYACDAQAWNALRETNLWQWLRSQKEFIRGRNLVFRGRRRPRAAVSAEEPLAKLEHQVGLLFHGDEEKSEAAWRVLDIRINGPIASSWDYALVRALREYNFDGWRDILELSASLAPKVAKATAAFQTALEAIERAVSLGIFSELPLSPNSVSRFMGRLQEWEIDQKSFPVHRNDPRSAERLFVFRMVKANRRTARANKAEAIVELMGLDGFHHQYDTRTVERLCREFTGEKRSAEAAIAPGHKTEGKRG